MRRIYGGIEKIKGKRIKKMFNFQYPIFKVQVVKKMKT
jgi:hypothetical protein